jgi:ribosomal protein L11 methyltransferase
MNWLEISLTLDGELAEAVADVLARYAHQGVSIESTAIKVNPDDEGEPIGPVRVRAFLPADDLTALDATRTKIEQDLFYLGMIQSLPQPTYTQVADADWNELWKANYKPIRVGERLVIIPAWLYQNYLSQSSDLQADAVSRTASVSNEIHLLMDPGMAFGTGTHPTTQLSLALLETYLKPGDQVFDVGCGSGILSVAAIKLGAASALGVDIDPESDRATRENAELNGVQNKIEFHLGSIDLVQNPQSKIHNPKFPIVVANILARVILKLLNQGLADTVAPNGVLLLSGILADQAVGVTTALHQLGFHILEQRQSGDWIALAAKQA